jgi:hypothetical protein
MVIYALAEMPMMLSVCDNFSIHRIDETMISACATAIKVLEPM